MLDPLTVSAYLLAPPAVFPRGDLDNEYRSRGDPLGRLAVFAASVAKGRAALKEQSDQFEKLYREAERANSPPEELEEAAGIILDNERKIAAALVPQIERLETWRGSIRQQISLDPSDDRLRRRATSGRPGLSFTRSSEFAC